MKYLKNIGLAFVLAALLAGNAWADRGYYRHHHHPRSSVTLGVYVGDPWIYSPYYYPYRVYSPPVYVPPVVVSPAPTVYIEQPAASATSPTLETGFWYYCKEAQAYYPYVKQCSGAWQKVAPQPAQ